MPVQPSMPPLDGIGQRNEMLRVRIGEMAERLGDLRTLTDDFAELIEPVETIAGELSHAKARVLELDALLAQEMDANQSLRREVDDLLGRHSQAMADLTSTTARIGRLEATLRENETMLDEQRLSLRERTSHANALERQLLAEVEQNQSLSLEVKTLRAEAQISEQALNEAERMLSDTEERRQILDGENRRLQNLAEEQSAELVSLSGRLNELEQQIDQNLQSISMLEAQLVSEQAARQRAVAQHEVDLGALKTERANSTMKIETLNARLAATDQILAQVRNQLREREETVRSADRAVKEASAERTTQERRVESLRGDNGRLATLLQEADKGRNEMEARCDMLVKALAAKDAALESANSRAANLSDRVETLTLRFEQERMALEVANRRLIEELQNERAERTLAQGALDIARESRSALQRQNESLKRATRSRHGELGGELPPEPPREGKSSNVRPFSALDKND
ncbi:MULTISPECIES: chromosome partitioning protein ParA [Aureimonas]|uniref:chromosome partitioning protein ParA n=1 Tax=Aureimonas TaxID=414371 RepID=UPI000AEDB20E|nr:MULTISPECIES: chromosome partitioning protein ParA [Aureimonas]